MKGRQHAKTVPGERRFHLAMQAGTLKPWPASADLVKIVEAAHENEVFDIPRERMILQIVARTDPRSARQIRLKAVDEQNVIGQPFD